MPSNTADYHELATIVEEFTQALVEWQSRNDGGWHSHDPAQKSDVWTTAGVLLWLLRAEPTKYHGNIERGLRFLQETQHIVGNVEKDAADGGWGYRLDRQGDSTATALSLLAFVRYAQINNAQTPRYINQMRSATDWLTRNMSGTGGFCSIPGSGLPLAFNTCWGSIALAESRTIPDLQTPVIDGLLAGTLEFVLKSKQNNGWGRVIGNAPDAIGTAYCTYLLQSMAQAGLLTSEQVQDEVNRGMWLRNNQSSSGSWDVGPMQSPIEATSWAVVTLLACNDDSQSPRIEGAIKYLRDMYVPGKGWPKIPGQDPVIWASYYACTALSAYIDSVRQIRTPGDGIRPSRLGKKVFVVHGHDEFIRKETKDLLIKHGLQPIVLDEQPSRGAKTVIEKFEYYAKQDGVDYAIVLCTADDMDSTEGKMTPRPNVLLELGWFIARLGRERICLACDGDVALPSDLGGILFINLKKENWKELMTNELRAVGLIT